MIATGFFHQLAHEWTFSGYKDSLVEVLGPGHFTGEIAFTLLIDVIVGLLLWPFIKKAIRRHDRNVHNTET